ncbi:MAG: SPOR domain-containing protein, partial [Deltaproteobacteria bacterium]
VLSSPNKAEIIPAAIRLVKEGYPVYITRARVKGKDYMRLRVGFFEEKAEADTEGKKIMAMLNFPGTWTLKAGKQEFEDFGRY